MGIRPRIMRAVWPPRARHAPTRPSCRPAYSMRHLPPAPRRQTCRLRNHRRISPRQTRHAPARNLRTPARRRLGSPPPPSCKIKSISKYNYGARHQSTGHAHLIFITLQNHVTTTHHKNGVLSLVARLETASVLPLHFDAPAAEF